MEPVFSAISEGDKENKMTWQQRSKSLEGLADNKQSKAFLQQDGHMVSQLNPRSLEDFRQFPKDEPNPYEDCQKSPEVLQDFQT